jgi:hypothetical protein
VIRKGPSGKRFLNGPLKAMEFARGKSLNHRAEVRLTTPFRDQMTGIDLERRNLHESIRRVQILRALPETP